AGWYLPLRSRSGARLTGSTCLWCASSGRCMEYPIRRVLPPADLCELRSARWGVCWALSSAPHALFLALLLALHIWQCGCCPRWALKTHGISWNQKQGDFSRGLHGLLVLSVPWSCSALTHLRKYPLPKLALHKLRCSWLPATRSPLGAFSGYQLTVGCLSSLVLCFLVGSSLN
uniref:Uncharacterized protein n=1 Tax=Accipiter nisus TaxID=211598 RepID=A0A8B9S002_9AVES